MSPAARKSKDTFSWWQDRIRILKGFQEEANTLYERTHFAYEVGPQAILKLGLLAYYLKVYTTIIKSNFPKAYYADLFAGPGLTKIETTGDVVLGSAVLADRVPSEGRKFDKLFLIEHQNEAAEALKQILRGATVMNQDANTVNLETLLGADTKFSIPTLGFVDPEGMDPNWTVLEPLLDRWSDVIINYQAHAVRRAAGRASEPQYAQAMTRFFGVDEWQNCKSDQDYLALYCKRIGKYKQIIITTKVRGHGGFFYYVIVAVKKTRGNQDWIDAIERAKTNVEKAGPNLIEQLLRIYKGEQSTLNHYPDFLL